METILQPKMITPAGFSDSLPSPIPQAIAAKRLKIREFISWSVCFAIVAGLTGSLKIMKIGVTMDTVTTSLFWLSAAGLVFFLFKTFSLIKNQAGLSVVHPKLN